MSGPWINGPLVDPGAIGITGGSISGTTGVALNLLDTAVQVAVPADTTEDIVATVTLPALKANSQVFWSMEWTATNNTNVKTVRVRLGGVGGTILFNPAITSMAAAGMEGGFANRGATNSQVASVAANLFHHLGAGGGPGPTAAVETNTGAVTLVFTGQKATVSGDTMQLERLSVWLLQ